jgi:hypothetical protein
MGAAGIPRRATTNTERCPMTDAQHDLDDDSGSNGGSILDNGGIDTDARAGRSLGIDPHEVPDEQTQREMEEDRRRRLAPENRPDGAEVDNTDRTFDDTRGQFTDSEDYDDSEPAPFSDPENPNNPDGSKA